MKKLFGILMLVVIWVSPYELDAQINDSFEKTCRIFGKVQGVSYDTFKNACSKLSSPEACNDLFEELGESISNAFQSRKDFDRASSQGCRLIIIYADEGVSFIIESLPGHYETAKSKLISLWDWLSWGEDTPFELQRKENL